MPSFLCFYSIRLLKKAIILQYIFQTALLEWEFWNFPIKVSLKFIPNSPIDNTSELVKIMAWRRPGDKPLPEPIVTYHTDSYTRHSASMDFKECYLCFCHSRPDQTSGLGGMFPHKLINRLRCPATVMMQHHKPLFNIIGYCICKTLIRCANRFRWLNSLRHEWYFVYFVKFCQVLSNTFLVL